MNEQLIKDYWIATEQNTFDEFDIEVVCNTSGDIIFREGDVHRLGGEFLQHTISTFDLISWVYSITK